jgi:saccharopine dehydrogenase (NAD+, L-lysine-forming)
MDGAGLLEAMKAADVVVVASGTSAVVRSVANAALTADIDYVDIQYSTGKIKVLRSMEEEIILSGRLFITDAGFHPGLPAALIRFAALEFDRLDTAIVSSLIRQDWKNLYSAGSTSEEFMREMAEFKPLFYRDGEWKKASMIKTGDYLRMDFGPPFGEQQCVPMYMEELAAIPLELPDLKKTGFYIAGFHWFIDLIVTPVILLVLKLFPARSPARMGKIYFWFLERFSRPPFRTILQVDAEGDLSGSRFRKVIRLSHEDGYWFTAIPAAALLKQYLEGNYSKPGLFCMGNVVQPEILMQDMESSGIEINSWTTKLE